ncbi:cobalamin biosynthesis protein [Rhodoferax sp.]|uniref:cobalamin biosynthesis protein n=1 Tax=Rhodoferax sp. TaxID=50421 RepID=UPI002ACE6E87|nr:cobalamin biosynthesis protein [Rhodoferax sp.]MDZ7921639.1 cobalamin biosynthesis protein [Rhodoferax sp.]
MSFIAILLALLLEQAKPLPQINPVHNVVRNWVRWVMRNFDAGKPQHGWLAWSLAVLGPSLAVLAVHWLLVWQLGWALAVVWNVVILYATLGFRQFSHHFTLVRDALHAGDEAAARESLAQWMRIDTSALPRSEMVRHVIEHSVLSAHRHVFGVFVWYSLLTALGLGPAGAVFYRVSEYVAVFTKRTPRPEAAPVSDAVRSHAQRAWAVIDWLPARVTALSFAFVGSFEEAVDSWRRHEAVHPLDNDGVVLAATAGAVNVRLGENDPAASGLVPELAHLRAVVGLVWRTVVMWMVFLALLSVARLIG